MKTIQELAKRLDYEVRNVNIPLAVDEDFSKVKSVFDFSNENGGTLNGFQFYNNFYLYPIN